MNLCTNAFHAMEQTGGILEISLGNCEIADTDLKQSPHVRPGPFVKLTISDTGTGIPPGIQSKIFDPYFTTKEIGKGTGMGLAITHGIVVSSGGFITCESETGKGTAFNIYFPAVAPHGIQQEQTEAIQLNGKERILFIDDEPMLAEMGQTMLASLGYKVTVCMGSSEALELFQSHPQAFDAIITDQTMPGMTGIDLAQRALQVRPDIPIVLCTGYSSLIDEQRAKACGVKGFAMKPVTKKELATILRTIFEKTATGSNAP